MMLHSQSMKRCKEITVIFLLVQVCNCDLQLFDFNVFNAQNGISICIGKLVNK